MASDFTSGRQPLTFRHWLILILAAIGFGFDIYVLLIMQYIGRELLGELLPNADAAIRRHWQGLLFWVPMLAGGAVGLVGGYLTDLLGRRRILTFSILLYAIATFASGYSTSLPMFLVLRCLTLIGVCVEFVAAIAWLAELFPQHEQRERVLGYTQAFSSFGGLTVAGAYLFFNHYQDSLPALQMPEFLSGMLGTVVNGHATWRYTLLSGVIPALPLILIRPFMPESPVWAQKKAAGTLKRPSVIELFSPALRRTTIVTTLMFACSYGVAFGGIQQVQYMVEAMPTYQVEAEKVSTSNAKTTQAKKAAITREMTGRYGTAQEIGGLLGRFLLAVLAVHIVSRRNLLRVFLVPCLLLAPLVFYIGVEHNRELFALNLGGKPIQLTWFHIGIFFVGLLTVAQFSFWGNYLPTVYPVHLRGTGESAAANLGGRILGTSFALVTSEVAGLLAVGDKPATPGIQEAANMAHAAGMVVGAVLLVGFLLSFFLPQPAPEKTAG
ncbi:MAG TPA: MFS transporter [Gemmataceae bacterium]|nr:MFS transporter [Gemmataceae bacterium]